MNKVEGLNIPKINLPKLRQNQSFMSNKIQNPLELKPLPVVKQQPQKDEVSFAGPLNQVR
jgi:hypothetical protein